VDGNIHKITHRSVIRRGWISEEGSNESAIITYIAELFVDALREVYNNGCCNVNEPQGRCWVCQCCPPQLPRGTKRVSKTVHDRLKLRRQNAARCGQLHAVSATIEHLRSG
jgi:hypothetical protein